MRNDGKSKIKSLQRSARILYVRRCHQIVIDLFISILLFPRLHSIRDDCKMRKAATRTAHTCRVWRIWPTLVCLLFDDFERSGPSKYIFSFATAVSPCLQLKGELSKSACAPPTRNFPLEVIFHFS